MRLPGFLGHSTAAQFLCILTMEIYMSVRSYEFFFPPWRVRRRSSWGYWRGHRRSDCVEAGVWATFPVGTSTIPVGERVIENGQDRMVYRSWHSALLALVNRHFWKWQRS